MISGSAWVGDGDEEGAHCDGEGGGKEQESANMKGGVELAGGIDASAAREHVVTPEAAFFTGRLCNMSQQSVVVNMFLSVV